MRRVLLDEGVPRPLARKLQEYGLDVRPFPNEWKQMSNGALLDRIVAEGFAVLITNDKNMRHQQTLGGRDLAVLVLPTNRLPDLLAIANRIADVLKNVEPGKFTSLPSTQGKA